MGPNRVFVHAGPLPLNSDRKVDQFWFQTGQTDRQTARQTDGQTHRQTDRQTDRQLQRRNKYIVDLTK